MQLKCDRCSATLADSDAIKIGDLCICKPSDQTLCQVLKGRKPGEPPKCERCSKITPKIIPVQLCAPGSGPIDLSVCEDCYVAALSSASSGATRSSGGPPAQAAASRGCLLLIAIGGGIVGSVTAACIAAL